MVKDRLNELKQKKSTGNSVTIDVEANNVESDDGGDERTKLRKTFERSEVIKQWIEQIEHNNQDVRVYLRRIEDLKYNQKDVEEKITSQFQNTTTIAHQISNKLKEVDIELKDLNADSAARRIKTIQYSTLKKRFEQAFLDNNQLLENYKNTQKQIIKSQLQAKGYFHVTDEEVTLLLDEGSDLQVFTDNILAETAEAKRVLASVEERHQQLLQIERMLTEVRDLFVQMSILIDSQQELVDRIEYQAQTATDYVGAGTVDLNSAQRKKKKYTKTKIYVMIAIVVVVIILLIILLR